MNPRRKVKVVVIIPQWSRTYTVSTTQRRVTKLRRVRGQITIR